jgi:phosphate:Na+ symporter
MLREGFTDAAAQVGLPQAEGWIGLVAHVLAGIVLTALVQSSSAAIALVLTAAQSGLLDFPSAAAVVIGSNVGTTVTAVIAALGATSNARRAAAAHVLFNLSTAVVALALLPALLLLTRHLAGALGEAVDMATALALFHTLFNVLGVVLMWPLADRLGRFLSRRFRTAEEVEARPRYLDAATAQVPALGVEALAREVSRLGGIAVSAAVAQVEAGPPQAGMALARAQATLQALDAAIDDFVVRLNRSGMAPETARRLAAVLRREGYYASVAEQLEALAMPSSDGIAAATPVADELATLRRDAAALLKQLDPQHDEADADGGGEVDRRMQAWDAHYRRVKAALLEAAAVGQLGPEPSDALLRSNSALRRAVQQAHKAIRLDEAGRSSSVVAAAPDSVRARP